MQRRACFIGRWQPWHKGHEWLIGQKLDQGIPVLILVRDLPKNDENPFTTEQTIRIISEAMKGHDVIVQAIPDIESINWGRNPGYEHNEFEPPPNVHAISATRLRHLIRTGNNSWKDKVNPRIWDLLKQYL